METAALFEQVLEICRQQEGKNLPLWEELPNIALYMDQVIDLMHDYLGENDANAKQLTPSMINNYVKMGVMPAPEKKKYSKKHMACLFIICCLKQVLSISAISRILRSSFTAGNEREAYNSFVSTYARSHRLVAESFQTELSDAALLQADSLDLVALVSTAAVYARAEQDFAESLLVLLPQEKKPAEEKKKKNRENPPQAEENP